MSKEETKKEDKKFWIFLGILAIVCILLRLFVFEFFHISGSSMIPTFEDGDYVFAEQISVYTKDISYDDIVIVEYPNGKPCVKRVIGTAGDTVEIKDGILVLNGKKIQEEYINEQMYDSMEPITVKENMIFVMGDNRNYSLDSRDPNVGAIPYGKIKGKVRFTVFPLSRIRIIK